MTVGWFCVTLRRVYVWKSDKREQMREYDCRPDRCIGMRSRRSLFKENNKDTYVSESLTLLGCRVVGMPTPDQFIISSIVFRLIFLLEVVCLYVFSSGSTCLVWEQLLFYSTPDL